MGYAVGSACYGSIGDAAAVSCATVYPLPRADTLVQCLGADAAGVLHLESRDSAGAVVASLSIPSSFPTCDQSSGQQQIAELWLLVIGSCAVLWALKAFVLRLVSNT